MKQTLLKANLLFIFASILFSCSRSSDDGNIFSGESELEVSMREEILTRVNNHSNDNSIYKKKFSKALSLAMTESKELRDFIRKESLEMFDNDYDILFYNSKDKIVTSNLTFREVLLPYFDDYNDLDVIESEFPLLTILVAKLPNNIFSAEEWNTDEIKPFVAYQPNSKSGFIYVNNEGEEFQVKEGHILCNAFVIIKSSDRVSITDVKFQDEKKMNYEIGFNLHFFDKSKNEVNKKGWITTSNKVKTKSWHEISSTFPPFGDHKITEAYEIYKNRDGWQRDFIYYDISPTQNRGSFNYDYVETIHNFKLNGSTEDDVLNMMRYISDSVDEPSVLLPSYISDGLFEFVFKCFVNGVNGIGSQVDLYLQCSGDDLFYIIWGMETWSSHTTMYIKGLGFNTMDDLYIPIVGWDIHDYSTSFKIAIEEVDPSGTRTVTETHTTSVATNFEALSGIVKVGLKYGSSAKRDITSRIQRVIHDKNDDLGEVTLNFADNFIIGYKKTNWFGYDFEQYETRDYNSGMCTMGFLPLKMQ